MAISNPITDNTQSTLVTTDTSANSLVVGGSGAGATTGTGGIKCGPVLSTSSVTDSVGSMATIRAGGIGIASQVAGDFIYAFSATQLARLAIGTSQQYPRINTAGSAWEFSSGSMTLLAQISGTSTAAGATNIPIATFSGVNVLTAKDTLMVMVTTQSVTQQTAGVQLYNVTDAAAATVNATQNAGETFQGPIYLSRAQASNTVGYGNVGGTSAFNATSATAFAIAGGWTSGWELALRHTGVTAGGTFSYNVACYRMNGQ